MLLKLEGIRKCFPGVVALDEVHLELNAGEVHALIGENGAGKSTLMKVLSGVYPHGSYEGRILKNGEELRFRSLRDASQAGVVLVHQELALLPELSVLDNLFLGAEIRGPLGFLKREAQQKKAEAHLQALELSLPLEQRVGLLSIGQQQRLEIARALLHDPEVLILDEPTSALPEDDAAQLLEWIRRLARKGTACVYISHRMEEIFQIADQVTVLRDGRSVWTRPREGVEVEAVIAAMVDRPPSDLYGHQPCEPGELVLALRGLRVVKSGGCVLSVPSLELRQGEILGLAGLMGAGRSCLLRLLSGALDAGTRVEGQCSLDGEIWQDLPASPAEARRMGLFLVPEDRKGQALFLEESVAMNTVCASFSSFRRGPVLDHQAIQVQANELKDSFRVKTPSVEQQVKTLSGGNQQKVLMARAALVAPKLLLLDEPTRGIDVGAKDEIYRRMERWTREGWTILWASSELQELLGISDRVLVLAQGELRASFHERPFDEQAVMSAATREPQPPEPLCL